MRSTWALLVRGAVATTTAAVIVGGMLHERTADLDGGFWAFTAVLLAPAAIYVIGVCSMRWTLLCGAPMLLVTCWSWVALFGSTDQLRGVFVLFALVVTLVISVAGTLADRLGEASR